MKQLEMHLNNHWMNQVNMDVSDMCMTALLRLFEMSVRTAKSFVSVEDVKGKEFMQHANEVQYINQMDTHSHS